MLLLEVVQVVLICGLGLAFAWQAHGDALLVVVLVVLGRSRSAGSAARGRHGPRGGHARRGEPDLAGVAVRRRRRGPLTKYGPAARDVLR